MHLHITSEPNVNIYFVFLLSSHDVSYVRILRLAVSVSAEWKMWRDNNVVMLMDTQTNLVVMRETTQPQICRWLSSLKAFDLGSDDSSGVKHTASSFKKLLSDSFYVGQDKIKYNTRHTHQHIVCNPSTAPLQLKQPM